MRLLIREYLGLLRERGELDAILPDLLTEMGFIVFSRPSVGTRQHGVDIGAVGIDDEDGKRKVFLFSVKVGNLTRSDWNVGQQALKPSLDEILHVYIRSRLPVAYAKLPIIICLTFGGGVDESIRSDVEGYIALNRSERIDFRQWDGDHLAKLIDEGPLGDSLLGKEIRRDLRKAAATVEEPDLAFAHFARLVSRLTDSRPAHAAQRFGRIRQMILSLWIMFAWAREAGNVEAPYRSSELALLIAWHVLKSDLGGRGKASESAGLLINDLVKLHHNIFDELYAGQVLPHADRLHAVSMAVGSSNPLDVNLKLFETIGRVALRGLWLVWQANEELSAPAPVEDGTVAEQIDALASSIIALVRNNPALLAPVTDHQAVDIMLAVTLLVTRPQFRATLDQWIDRLLATSIFAYKSHGRYPTKYAGYWQLAAHPAERTDAYRHDATNAATLYPLLALWAEALGRNDLVAALAKWKADDLTHSTFQLFYLDHDSEDRLYRGGEWHGAAVTGLPLETGKQGLLAFVRRENDVMTAYYDLSAVRLGHWPIVLTACRYHRLPLPPQIWRFLFDPAPDIALASDEAGAQRCAAPKWMRRSFLTATSGRLALAAGIRSKQRSFKSVGAPRNSMRRARRSRG
jgi:hypothetical protein